MILFTFSGLFGKKKIENKLDPEELILTYKVADVLHRLDEESILVIGDPDSIFTKNRVKSQLTKKDTHLPSPKDIKNVYFVNAELSETFVIGRKNKGHFYVLGEAKNLTNPKKTWLCDDGFQYDGVYAYDDILKTKDGISIQFVKTKNESNKLMYDAKYPVESFLSEGGTIGRGLIFNSTKKAMGKVRTENTLKCEKSEYNKEIAYKTFEDIAGMDDTVEKMKKTVLYPILYPEAFPEVTNCGTILYGPPGTGKTLLAQAILGEAKKRDDKDIHFINIDAQSLTHSLVGRSEAMWRDVFAEAVDNQPSIIFIDEIDAILSARIDDASSAATKYCNNVVSQFLTLISDIEKRNDRVYIIGATNRLEAIDEAIKRSGRLGNKIEVKRPDEAGCLAIFNHYLKNKNVSENFDRESFAKELYNLGYTGADITNLVSLARDNMYERYGIYQKMDEGTYKSADLKGLQYEKVDFLKSIDKSL